MVNRLKVLFASVMILGQFGVFATALIQARTNPSSWKEAVLAVLFGIANTIIFFC